MRLIAMTVLALGAAALAAPAEAGTYGGGYPVCLQVYGPLNYYECGYSSIPQCNMSAAGRAAQCVINPYFASAEFRPARKRYRYAY